MLISIKQIKDDKQSDPQAGVYSFTNIKDPPLESQREPEVIIKVNKKILKDIELTLYLLHCIPYFAKHLLLHFNINNEFKEEFFTSKKCFILMLKLIKALQKTITDKTLLDYFALFLTSIFKRFHAIYTKKELYVEFLEYFTELLQSLNTAPPFTDAGTKVKEAMLKLGVLADFMNICDKTNTKVYQLMLTLADYMFKGNPLVYSNSETNTQLKTLYQIILNKLLNSPFTSITKHSLNTLINICLSASFSFERRNAVGIIKDIGALEYYYKILYKFIKRTSLTKELATYVLLPLDCLMPSLCNVSILAKSNIPHLLFKIIKMTSDQDISIELFNHLGSINSMHSTPKHIKRIMRCFVEYSSKEFTAFSERLSKLLGNSISGESIQDFFYFNSNCDSFITINENITWSNSGLCFMSYIRFDPDKLSNLTFTTQWLFTFAYTKSHDAKYFGLGLADKGVIFKITGQRNEVVEICFDKVVVRENVWQRVVLFNAGKKVILLFDEDVFTANLSDSPVYAKEYNLVAIGTEMSIKRSVQSYSHFFKGEMSLLCFMSIEKISQSFVKLVSKELNLLSCIDGDLSGNYFFDLPSFKEEIKKEILDSVPFILNPRKLYFMELNKGPITLRGVKKPRIVHNYPGRKVFSNLGGLRTIFPLIMNYTYKSEHNK
jgi:hypothetical protein